VYVGKEKNKLSYLLAKRITLVHSPHHNATLAHLAFWV